MRSKLYKVAGLNPESDEPPHQKWFVQRWKNELSQETWFVGENVSNCILFYLKQFLWEKDSYSKHSTLIVAMFSFFFWSFFYQ